MAQGGTARREADYSRNLNALQFQDRRNTQAANDNVDDPFANLSDSSDLTKTQASPIELPARSYTSGAANDNDAPASTLMEMEAQRTRDTKMRKTGEQFVGAPIVPTMGDGSRGPETGAPQEKKQERSFEMEEQMDDDDADEIEQAQDLFALQQQALLQARGEERRAAERAASEQGASAMNVQIATQNSMRLFNLINALLSWDLLNGFVLLGTVNAQLVNKHTFQNYTLLGDLSLFEVMIVLFFDLCVLVLIIVGLFGLLMLMLTVGGAAAGVDSLKKMIPF
ncbi:MAG: hypothetical protein WC787_01105 [Patescibacteria group bacterium]|jgi:hypothetical protein